MPIMKTTFFQIGFSVMCLFFAGCLTTEYNLATNQEEILLQNTEKEIKIGDALSRQLESQFEINNDIDINQRARDVMDKIIDVCDRKELVYFVKIIEDKELNAVSLPGGYVYIFKGLMDHIKNDDQLAGVIAHEVGHLTAKHAMKRLQASYGALILQVLAGASGRGDMATGVNVMLASVFTSYSRQDEYEADRLAVKYTKKAGYNPEEMVSVLRLLKEEAAKEPPRTVSLFRTHPYLNERISSVNKEISGKLEYRDYLNLMDSE